MGNRGADLDHLRNAFVADGEWRLERHPAADAADDRIHDTERDAELEWPRHPPVDGQRVTVAATGEEGPHDGLVRRLNLRVLLLAPCESALGEQLQLDALPDRHVMIHIIVASTTRTKMVQSAALLLREHGVSGTSFHRVLDDSSTPRGSIAHHFPGGKREMIADAVRWAGGAATAAMCQAIERGDPPAELFSSLCAAYRHALVDSDYAAGCPVGAVALESFDDEPLRTAVGEVFTAWRTLLRQAMTDAGHDAPAAERLTDTCIASLEGALMLTRIDRSTRPLDH